MSGLHYRALHLSADLNDFTDAGWRRAFHYVQGNLLIVALRTVPPDIPSSLNSQGGGGGGGYRYKLCVLTSPVRLNVLTEGISIRGSVSPRVALSLVDKVFEHGILIYVRPSFEHAAYNVSTNGFRSKTPVHRLDAVERV